MAPSTTGKERKDKSGSNSTGAGPTEEKYKQLKRKLKDVLQEHDHLSGRLEKARSKISHLKREKELLLDRLERHEHASSSESNSDVAGSTDDDSSGGSSDDSRGSQAREGRPAKRLKSAYSHLQEQFASSSRETTPSRSSRARIKPAVKRPPVITKLRKIHEVDRNPDGTPVLPLKMGILTIYDLGTIVYDRKSFHTERYIFPVGYRMSRGYASTVEIGKNTNYTCRISDGGDGPRFHITPDDALETTYTATSATGAWTAVIRAANALRERENSNSASGPDYFGLAHPSVCALIQELPNAGKCENYVRQQFEESKTPRVSRRSAAKSSAAAVSATSPLALPSDAAAPSSDDVHEVHVVHDPPLPGSNNRNSGPHTGTTLPSIASFDEPPPPFVPETTRQVSKHSTSPKLLPSETAHAWSENGSMPLDPEEEEEEDSGGSSGDRNDGNDGNDGNDAKDPRIGHQQYRHGSSSSGSARGDPAQNRSGSTSQKGLGYHWAHVLAANSHNAVTAECGEACYNYLAVYRVSLSVVLFHGTLCLLTIGVRTSSDPRGVIQNGVWPVKFLIWFGTLVGTFFIPAQHLANYWIAAITFSGLFILLQSYILVDFGWNWSTSWVTNWEETNNPLWKFLLIFFTLTKYSVVIAGTVVLYLYFTTNSGCGLNIMYVTVNLILVLAISILSLLPAVQNANPRSGIFQSAILSLYATYLVGSAIGSEPNDAGGFHCSPQTPGTGEDALSRAMVYVGLAITFLALGYSAVSAGSMSPWTRTDVETGGSDPHDETEETTYSYAFFHFVFVLAAMYMAAVITNWSTLELGSDTAAVTNYAVNQGFASVWVKIATSWACIVLYTWTLLAPLVFPDRDFSV
ncbi:Serine incorporator 3 [Thoreauomyces humboldtii]|nr:Serine incorporator 3 [Thoreauomyces humboldtii]